MNRRFQRGVVIAIVAGCIGSVHVHALEGGAASEATAHRGSANVDFPRFPSLSPDGARVIFSWRGDLWLAPSNGGAALRLTAHPADDLRSAWSPDGSMIVFESNRDGVRNLWTMRPDGTEVRQLTTLDTPVTLTAVGRNTRGEMIVSFDMVRENDLYRSPRPYLIPLGGGRIERVFDAFGSRTAPSPDGTRILFDRGAASWNRRGYRGADARNLWLFDVGSGSFRQLTTWEGNDGMGQWAADGSAIYLSDAEGGVVNVMRRSVDAPGQAPGTALTQLQRDARDLTVSADGRTAAYGSWGRLFTLDLTQSAPTPREIVLSAAEDAQSDSAWRRIDKDVTEALLNPDGQSMAMVAYGDVFVRSLDDKTPVVRLTDTPWQEREIAWSPDGLTLYFTANESGREEIRAATVQRTRRDLKKAFDAGTIVPSPATPAAAPPATATAAPTATATPAPAATASKSLPRASTDWGDALEFSVTTVVAGDEPARSPDPSPDGKSIAYRRGAGDLVLRDRESGQDRVIRRGWDQGISWRFSPDSRWIAFQQQDRDFNSDIWIVPTDGSAEPVNVTRHPDSDVDPRWSADGRVLAFRSDRVNNEFDVYTVWLDRSLDSKTPAEIEKYFKDAADKAKKRKPLAGPKPPAPARDTASKDDAEAKRSADGASAAVGDVPTNAGTGDAPSGDGTKVAEGSAPSQRAAVNKEEVPEAAPVLSLADAYLRVRRISSLPLNEGQLEMTPGGDRIIFSGEDRADREAEEPNSTGGSLLSVKWDGTDQKKLGAGGSVQQVSLTGDKVVVLRAGSASTVPPAGGEAKNIDFAASTLINRRDQMRRRFLGVSRALGEGFYHPTMKGLDWEALTAQYLELATAARTADEFDDVAARFIGELNASHLGVNSPADPTAERRPQGRLGVRVKPVNDGFEVVSILPDGPAAKSSTPLRVGDVIIAVAGRSAKDASMLEDLLTARVGEETVVRVRRSGSVNASPAADASAPGATATATVEVDALIVPIGGGELAALAYRATRLANAAEVDRLSNGRIGYIHIQSMNQPSLDEFERDLYAAAEGKDGLIIDVRNNGGGWTADRLLASIMSPVHAYTVPRGAEGDYRLGYPRDRLFIQRYTLPITMLANEKSFSNAEIVAHAFKTLKRGTLVGETTNGGVISTGGTRLLDGTTVRMPFRGWYLPDGRDMENNGAVPDIRVPQTPEDESRGDDAQLRRAAEELLGRLGPERKRSNDG